MANWSDNEICELVSLQAEAEVARQFSGTVTDSHLLPLLSTGAAQVLGGRMNMLCRRSDFLGQLGRHYLMDPDYFRPKRSPMSRHTLKQHWRPRLSLRFLASYRTLLLLLLLYVLGALVSLGPLSSTALLLMGALLYGILETLFRDRLKTQ